jgi:UDP-N-acetylmuramyl pentapeptide phosphotransferase/UDP-N-acetylglucosamine-1-phosphate transferase
MALIATPALVAAHLLGVVTLDQSWKVVLTTALALLYIGIIDDRRDLGALGRMVAQVGAALALVYLGGFRVETLGALGDLGRFSVPFTILVIVTFLNACNMVDGADGLLGAVLLPPMLSIALVAAPPLSAGAGLLAAVITGFLFYNWPASSRWRSRLRTFMGNGGALFIALCVAAVLIRASGRGGPILPGGVALLTLIPLADMATTCVRRIIHRVSPLSADRGHIHHRLMQQGLTPGQLATGYLLLSASASVTAVLLSLRGVDGIWLWTMAALILTSATLAEVWFSTRQRVRAARDLRHAGLDEPRATESVQPRVDIARAHPHHPLPDEFLDRTGTGG